jgi:hypothetical protein
MRPEQAGSSTGAERFAFWSTSPKPSEGAKEYEFSPTDARDLVIDFSPNFSDAGGVISLATNGSACYEWATQPFDQHPDQPTHLKPGKRIGFDLAVVDKDVPASSPEAMNEPEEDRNAWVYWGPRLTGMKVFSADTLREPVLGKLGGILSTGRLTAVEGVKSGFRFTYVLFGDPLD